MLSALCSDSVTTQVSFSTNVRPVLSNHCFACHGPDEATREAGLRLDIASDVDTAELLQRNPKCSLATFASASLCHFLDLARQKQPNLRATLDCKRT